MEGSSTSYNSAATATTISTVITTTATPAAVGESTTGFVTAAALSRIVMGTNTTNQPVQQENSSSSSSFFSASSSPPPTTGPAPSSPGGGQTSPTAVPISEGAVPLSQQSNNSSPSQQQSVSTTAAGSVVSGTGSVSVAGSRPNTLSLGPRVLLSKSAVSSPTVTVTSNSSGDDSSERSHRKSRKDRDKEESTPKIPIYQVQLERVLGLTVTSNAALDCDPNTGTIAYPAGCTVVLLNARKSRQQHVQNWSRKTVTCVTFSSCGRFLATGECGHQPSVRVWDVAENTQLSEFQGHKYGVSCVAFSPTQKYVVSVGSQHDMIVNVWDWRGGIKVASNKFSSKVKAVSFAENGSYFVTVGNRHVKFWYLEVARGSKFKEPVPLTGRSAILGEQRNNYFCDVACGRGEMGDSTFAITKSGLLCEFNNRRLLDKWVELRTSSANCLVAGEQYIFVGCGDAIVRCFNPSNLQFITTLPRTHYLGVDVALGQSIKHMGQHPSNARYPDTVAVAYDSLNNKLTAVYNDHSLYIWDVTDIKRVGKSHSYLYHSACIWGVESYPDSLPGASLQQRLGGDSSSAPLLPKGSFITCSSDDTIRVWNIAAELPEHPSYKRNIYSNDLLRVMYVDPELSFLKDTDISPSGQQTERQSGGQQDGSYDSRNGVRCIKISPDGRHIASGDRAGNIRIHELESLEEVCKIEAHDAEVLCLEYSRPDTRHSLLASASRDRLIHVFDVLQDYQFLQTLDDHSSAITSVRFYQGQQGLQMVSCSADRSIIFRTAVSSGGNEVSFNRGHNIAGKTTLYDMEVDYGQRHILTACQDRNIRVYNVNSGKQSKSFKGSIGDDGSLIKVVLDPSGIYAATSCTDKNMCIYDYYTAECLATMYGHSELVTGLKFTNDGRHLITVSGDGCIFVWRLPHDMSQTITARLAQQAERAAKEMRRASQSTSNLHPSTKKQTPLHHQSTTALLQQQKSPLHLHGTSTLLKQQHRTPSTPVLNQPLYDNEHFRASSAEMFDRQQDNDMEEPDYRFSIGQLPTWAKKKVSETGGGTGASSPTTSNPDMPKGRWAQKVQTSSTITFKSHYDTDSVIPFPAQEKAVMESESSKESSLEDGAPPPKPQPPPRPRRNSTGTPSSIQDTISPSHVNTRRGGAVAESTPKSFQQQPPPPPASNNNNNNNKPQQISTPNNNNNSTPRSSRSSHNNAKRHHQAAAIARSHTTDDSDGSSLRVDGGGTTTDHDGDVEDCSEQDDVSTEPDQTMYYYPHNDDTASEFQVNAMDVEELRRSSRRQHSSSSSRRQLSAAAAAAGAAADTAPASAVLTLTQHQGLALSSAMSGSQDSDEEEEVSTPSGDTADRTMLSMLSCESVDKLGRRESFLKSTYESLDADTRTRDRDNKNSISYRFNARHKDASVSSKREELLKKIEETRKKLQSIGYKSSLRSSKSISDLSNIPEKDTAFMSLGGASGGSPHNTTAPDGWSGDSGFSSSTGGAAAATEGGGTAAGGGSGNLRRACSLSDLTNACATPRRLLPNPTTAGGRKSRNSSKAAGRLQQQQMSAAAVARSNSANRLDQEDHQQQRIGPLRATVSSTNKMTPRALKRKSSLSQAVSTGDIRNYLGDSSSEDNSPPDQTSLRNRSFHADRRTGGPVRAVSERDLSRELSRSCSVRSSCSQQQQRLSGGTRRQVSASDLSRPSSAASTIDMSPDDYSALTPHPAFPFDLDAIPLSAGVVESMCEWAVESCERLSQVWWRVCAESSNNTHSPPAPGEEQQQRALKALMLGAAARAQHALSPLMTSSSSSSPSTLTTTTTTTTGSSSSSAATAAAAAAVAAAGANEKDPRVVAMMQQYTDMLVNMVQQKMAQAQPSPPGPT